MKVAKHVLMHNSELIMSTEQKKTNEIFQELNAFAFDLQNSGMDPQILAMAFIEIGININREFMHDIEFKEFILNLTYEYKFQSSKMMN